MRLSWLRLFLAGVLVLAALAGYLVWSGSAGRLLHREIESQLSLRLERAVRMAAVELRFDRGLRLSVDNLRIHATADSSGEPVLRAGEVVAWIDIPALLIGRISLSSLVLEGPSLRIERAADGSFPTLGLPGWDAERFVDRDDIYGEGLVRAIERLEPAAQRMAERFGFASRIELHDGSVSFLDHTRPADEPPLRLEYLQILAQRDRLSDAGSLEVNAIVVDGLNAPFPIRFGVHREEDQPFVWDLSWDSVSLTAARQRVPSLPLLNGLSGRWSANLHASRDASGEHTLTLGSKVLNASLVFPRSQQKMAYDALDFGARIEIDGKQVRLREGKLGGDRIRSDFEVTLERPLRPASRAKLETRLQGVEFGDIRSIVEPLEDEFETARSLGRLIEPVESGRIAQIEASGTTTLQQWQALWRGPERDLPDDFLLAAAFDQVGFETGSSEDLEELAGEVEWIGDKLVLRGARARFRGRALPQMDLTIDGVSQLLRANREAPRITANPPPIPGLAPLARILRPRDPNALPPVKAIGLAIERLEHPLLRWPLVEAQVLVEPVRHGVQIHVREGLLGGANVAGDVVWSSEPDDGTVTANLSFTAPAAPPPPIESAATTSPEVHAPVAASEWPASRWGEGEVEIEFRPRPRLPFARAKGYFRLEEAVLVAREVEIALAPQGKIETRGTVGLEDPDTVGLDLTFALTDGRFESISEFIAIPPNLITGGVGATGTLFGRVRPDTSFVAELDGQVRADATTGRVALGVPLLLRLSRATEGYNPFANEHEIGYETMSATIDFDHGVLDSQDFKIEGPLRVYARARIDTDAHPVDIRAIVGIFLFRAPNEILSNVPILRSLLPGSERGLIGAYFKVKGALKQPEIEALPLATFLTAVPSAIKTPMRVLQYLFEGGEPERPPHDGHAHDRKARTGSDSDPTPDANTDPATESENDVIP